jgi:tetratricopeptide (TPR) repeat protein
VLGDRTMFMSGEREQLAARSGKLSDVELGSLLEATRKARVADERRYSLKAVDWFSHRLAQGQIRGLRDVDDWNRAFHQADGKRSIRLMVDTLPDDFGAMLSDSTFKIARAALQPRTTSGGRQWDSWAIVLRSKFARYDEAEAAYRDATSRDSTVWAPWHGLGYLLHYYLRRYEDAETTYREAISRAPSSIWSWLGLGDLLQDPLQRYDEAETAYREAIRLNPDLPDPWDGLGILYCDHLDRLADAAEAFDHAVRLDPNDEVVQQNRLFLRRDFLGEGIGAWPLMVELHGLPNHVGPDTTHLHETLFAAYDSNWGLASEALAKALTIRSDGFSPFSIDDWLRASAVLLHLNYGAELLLFLDQHGHTARVRPWVEAVRALHRGDRRALQNIAPEIRTTAEEFFDGIEKRLNKLPEKTRRRPLPKARTPRPRRAKRG